MRTRRDFIATPIRTAAASLKQEFRSKFAFSMKAGSDVPDEKTKGRQMQDLAEDPRITRARLSGPEQVTKNATAAEIETDGTLKILIRRSNE